MSRLVARILLAILMFPAAGIVYRTVWYELDARTAMSTYRCLMNAGLVTWIGVAVWWSILWLNGVRWTRGRVVWTVTASVLALATNVVAQLAFDPYAILFDRQFDASIISVSVIVAWLIATVFIWRETSVERIARVSAASGSAITCPTCGYNLTGLGEARCPECGARFTLDELLAAQPARAGAGELS